MKYSTRAAVLLSAALLAASLTACGSQSQTTANTDSSADTQQTTSQTAAQDTRIQPLPSSFDPTNLTDCMLPVSFSNDDIQQDEKGGITIHLTAWEQELFDAADITGLKAGDTIVVRGKDIAVESVETADGVVQINGGLEQDGIDFAPSESGGTYYESNAAVTEYPYNFVEVAQLTLSVNSDTFTYTDSSDLENPEQTYSADDLLNKKDEVDFSCSAMNGTAHIVNSQIDSISRIFMP